MMTRYNVHMRYHPRRQWAMFGVGGIAGFPIAYCLTCLGYHWLQVLFMTFLLGLCWISFFNRRWPIYEVLSIEEEGE